MKNILHLYKPIGVTPFQLIQQFRIEHPEYQDIKLGYAGRLDPMADGLLLVLVGEENKKRKQYEEMLKLLQEAVRPEIEAIERSERLTGEDMHQMIY